MNRKCWEWFSIFWFTSYRYIVAEELNHETQCPAKNVLKIKRTVN